MGLLFDFPGFRFSSSFFSFSLFSRFWWLLFAFVGALFFWLLGDLSAFLASWGFCLMFFRLLGGFCLIFVCFWGLLLFEFVSALWGFCLFFVLAGVLFAFAGLLFDFSAFGGLLFDFCWCLWGLF